MEEIEEYFFGLLSFVIPETKTPKTSISIG